jgi:hypothetical protein
MKRREFITLLGGGAIVFLNGSDNVTSVSLFAAVRGDHDHN